MSDVGTCLGHRGIYCAKYYGQGGGGVGNSAGEKNEKWGSGEQNEKEGKRGNEKGERKKKKRKRGRVNFLLI